MWLIIAGPRILGATKQTIVVSIKKSDDKRSFHYSISLLNICEFIVGCTCQQCTAVGHIVEKLGLCSLSPAACPLTAHCGGSLSFPYYLRNIKVFYCQKMPKTTVLLFCRHIFDEQWR